jgi:hypothetical protein
MSVVLIILWLAGSPVIQVTEMTSVVRCEAVAKVINAWAEQHDTRILAVCAPK